MLLLVCREAHRRCHIGSVLLSQWGSIAMKRNAKAICLTAAAVVAASMTIVGTAGAAPVWTVNGRDIQANTAIFIKQVGYLEMAFTEAANRYTVACNTDNRGRNGSISPPGADRMTVFSLPAANCTVKIGSTATGCRVTSLELRADSTSTLGGTGPSSFTDAFANYELGFVLAVIPRMTCPITGSYTMRGGAAMTGTWANSSSQLTFNGVSVTLAPFTTPTFSVVDTFSAAADRVGIGESAKSEQPDWLIAGSPLANEAEKEVVAESGLIELKSEKLTIKCIVGNGAGTITGGEPGKGTIGFELEDCSDVGASECTVEEPVELGNAKTTAVVLSAKEATFGAKFEELAGTINIAGSGCGAAGEYSLTGNAVAFANASAEELEFNEPAEEGSTLKLGGNTATLVAKFKSDTTTPAEVAEASAAPYWTVGGTRLVAGKTHNFDAKAKASFVLTSGAGKVTCTGLGTVNGVLLGSNFGTNGTAGQVSVFSGCSLTGNGSACHLAPTEGSAETTTVITTNPTRSEQVENVVGTKAGSKLLEEFYPASKAAGFVKLNFGGECTLKSTIVSGSSVAEVVLDNASEGSIELGQTPQERTSWLLRFPATPITKVWLVSGGVGKDVETGVTAFGEEATQTGTALLLLASSKFTPEPSALWSPLP
jgi:hypothetical protein